MLVLAAPGYVRRTGYYYRVSRDSEFLEQSGCKVRTAVCRGWGFFEGDSAKRIPLRQIWKLARTSSIIVFQNISMVFFGPCVSAKRRWLVLHGTLEDAREFQFGAIKVWLYRRFLSYAARHFDKIICVSNALRTDLLDQHGDIKASTSVLPNIPSQAFFESLDEVKQGGRSKLELREMHSVPTDALVIAFVGNLQSWQNFDGLVRLFRSAIERSTKYHLLILTTEIDRVEAVLSGAKIPGSAYTLRTVPNHEVPAYLSLADFLYAVRCNTAVNRVACPTKAVEYLFSGTPILVSEHLGDITDIVRASGGGTVVTEEMMRDPAGVLPILESYQHTGLPTEALRQFSRQHALATYCRLIADDSREKASRS